MAQTLLGKAVDRKNAGNNYFTMKPPDLERAVASYKAALDYLPPCPRRTVVPKPPLTDNATSGLAEVNDEEAAAIEEQQHVAEPDSDSESREREEVEEEVRECTKACWGNLGACYTSLVRLASAVAPV